MIMQSDCFVDCLLWEIEDCLDSFAHEISENKDIAARESTYVCCFFSSMIYVFLFCHMFFHYFIILSYLNGIFLLNLV